MASRASLGKDYLHLLCKRNHITERSKKVRGAVIAAELVGDSKCPSLIAVSVYDTKPVHFLSMAVDNIKWIEKKREVYDRSIGQMATMKFLRVNVKDDYNHGMGGADIADQIRGSYRFYHWLKIISGGMQYFGGYFNS